MSEKPDIIFLCGFSGSGKTEVGGLLAKKLIYAHTDTDDTVESVLNKSIAEIFARMGEAKFRFAEGDVVRMAILNKPQVLSLGGGTIHDQRMLNFIKHNGYLIYLKTSPETIYDRLKDSHLRPLVGIIKREEGLDKEAVMKRINELMETREKLYLQADKIISTEGKSSGQVAEEIGELIESYGD